MRYRKVPKTGDALSILGYGCMRFPTRLQVINEKLAEKQILLALDQGVNYFDTAYPYHNRKSEPFLGKVLYQNRCRDRVRIATKLPHWMARNSSDMHRLLDEQLARLKTDRIDYYLIHSLTGDLWEMALRKGVIEFLDQALASGRILNAGFSFHGLAEEFAPIVDAYDWTFCQIQYNFLDTRNQAGTAGLRYAAAKDLAVMVMEPLRGGNLARTPPPEVRQIWAEADQERTPVDWSLSWIWNHPEVTVVLSGMNHERQINENLALADKGVAGSLSAREETLVKRAAEAFRQVMKVGCTGCQYCMPCPAGVNIPGCFDQYNAKHAFKDRSARLMYLFQNGGLITEKVRLASRCVVCGKCVEKCPQNLAVPELLALVARDMEGAMTRPLIWLGRRMIQVRKG